MKKTEFPKTSTLADILTRMLRIRIFEEKTAKLAVEKKIQCPVHLYVGQEAIASGVCANLTSEDQVFSTHRSHGHYIAKGGDLNALMAEIYGKASGCSKGHGGSMHIIDQSAGFMGSSAIVAGTIPIAVGAAFRNQFLKTASVSVAFFGDGATDEGLFYECINIATLYKLPILFVCENNRFSTHLPDFMRQSNPHVSNRIKNFKIRTQTIDGNDPIAVYQTAKTMIERARKGEGPALLECMTYRWLAHVGPTEDLDIGYRLKKDVLYWRKKCPIKNLENILIKKKLLSQIKISSIKKDIKKNVNKTILFSEKSKLPNSKSLYLGLNI